MKYIDKYYKNKVECNDTESFESFLKQVGKTFLGKTISKGNFVKIINSIKTNLDIKESDNIIDLGCANGLITYNISTFCQNIIGYDLSKELINTAIRHHQSNNIEYFNTNILKINFQNINRNKMYMYEVIQHLEYREFKELLIAIGSFNNNYTFLVSSIPDSEKLFNFYNTEERKKYYFKEILEKGKFHIGNWWYKDQIKYLCEELSLKCTIIDQDLSLHTSHYRFDCLIEKV